MSYLYLLNLVVWFYPLLLLRGGVLLIYIIAAYIISASYWLYFPVSDFLGLPYSVAIIDDHIRTSLKYSIAAGVAFSITFMVARPKYMNFGARLERVRRLAYELFMKIPLLKQVYVFKFIVFLLLLLVFYVLISSLGVYYDRPSWLLSSSSKLVLALLSICGAILFLVVLFDYRKNWNTIGWAKLNTLFLVVLFVFAVGFDGSRRAAFFALFGYIFVSLLLALSGIWSKRVKMFSICSMVFLIGFAVFLALGRNFSPGWELFRELESLGAVHFSLAFRYLFTPMPTAHVNTHIIEYVILNGTQGYESYINGLLNMMFPRFIFGEYIFGSPLVTELHQELGWYGFDFGYMAEAIYAGGLSGVIIMHVFLAMVLAITLRGCAKGRLLAMCFLIGFVFALFNSLRSDFMNFAKSFFYISIFVYVLLSFARLSFKRRVA